MNGQFFCWAANFEIATAMRKPNHTVSVRDIEKLRVITGWIKSDSERLVETGFGKNLGCVWFSVAGIVSQDLDLMVVTLHNKDVTVGCGQEKSGIAKAAGVELYLKTDWNL